MTHNFKTFTESFFGDVLKFTMPIDCDMVVMCVDTRQHEPVGVFLPHQIYKKDIIALGLKYPDAKTFTLIPYKSSKKLTYTIK